MTTERAAGTVNRGGQAISSLYVQREQLVSTPLKYLLVKKKEMIAVYDLFFTEILYNNTDALGG